MQSVYAVVANVWHNLYAEIQTEEIECENKTLYGYVCAVSVILRETFNHLSCFV